MIYLFVLDDSLTSQRFTTRTEELIICMQVSFARRFYVLKCTWKAKFGPLLVCI